MMGFIGLLLLGQVATGYVNDYAEIISPAVEARLEEKLEDYAGASGNELAVVTLKSLEGDTVENAAVTLFEQWGIGQKNKDNGVLLLIAPNERELRIEVGYGLEPVLTDSRAGTIIREVITPKFKENDYDAGITGGVEAIITVLSGQDLPQPVAANNDDGLVVLAIFLMVIFFIWFWLMRRRFRSGAPGSRKSSWSGWSSSKSSGSSFGGFSGGRSGGGGSSGKW